MAAGGVGGAAVGGSSSSLRERYKLWKQGKGKLN
jgi:hypothetical protein